MSWNQVGTETAKKAEFLSFPTGITNIRILDPEPFTRWTHWVPSARRSVTCPGRGCPICQAINIAKANKEEPKFTRSKKHSMNVINRTTGNVEIMEQGNGFFEELFELHKDEGDVRGYDIKVKRTGNGTNTKYRLTALEAEELTADEIKLAEENKVELEEYFSIPTIEQVTRLMNGEDPKEVFSSNGDSDEDISLV